MSTESIFLAGAKLASYVIGKRGPIQVIYTNWLREFRSNQRDSDNVHRPDNPYPDEPYYETQDIDTDDESMDSADTLEESSGDEGMLGKLFLGENESLITYEDIEELIDTMIEADYFAHYPLVDVSYDETERLVEFHWES